MSDIIAIDGPASVGKSTIAKKISNTFHCPILYSGRLYRVIALEIVKRKISTKNKPAILECLNLIDKISLESKNLFSSEIDELSSIISKKKYIRDALKDFQRSFPKIYLRQGAMYLTKISAFKKFKSLQGGLVKHIVVKGKYAVNIDDKEDLVLANHYFNKKL